MCVDVEANIEVYNDQRSCIVCVRVFTSQYHFVRHQGSSMCKNKMLNMIVEARSICVLQEKLENNEIIVHQYKGDMSYLAKTMSNIGLSSILKRVGQT